MSCSWIVFQGGFLLKSPLLVENYSPNARHAHTAYGKCSQNNEKHMKRTILAAALIAQTSAWAALETVDFSVLPAAADITAPGQLSLGPVTFSYDGFGAGTASIDSTGITGQAGGNLLMSFATPATTLNFTYDFGGNTAAPGDLTLRVFYRRRTVRHAPGHGLGDWREPQLHGRSVRQRAGLVAYLPAGLPCQRRELRAGAGSRAGHSPGRSALAPALGRPCLPETSQAIGPVTRAALPRAGCPSGFRPVHWTGLFCFGLKPGS